MLIIEYLIGFRFFILNLLKYFVVNYLFSLKLLLHVFFNHYQVISCLLKFRLNNLVFKEMDFKL